MGMHLSYVQVCQGGRSISITVVSYGHKLCWNLRLQSHIRLSRMFNTSTVIFMKIPTHKNYSFLKLQLSQVLDWCLVSAAMRWGCVQDTIPVCMDLERK